MRWAGHGDNAVPDPAICEFVKEWNATHAWPRFVISSTSEAFRAFEQRYGDQLPQVRGDWTPYWEDGAGSSAAETAHEPRQLRAARPGRDALGDARPEALSGRRSSRRPGTTCCSTPSTPGARIAASREPASPFTADQWNIKQSYATAANLQSRQLLERGRAERRRARSADADRRAHGRQAVARGHLQHHVLAADRAGPAAARSCPRRATS